MTKTTIFISILLALSFSFLNAHKLSDFGAIPDDPSLEVVSQNGLALESALKAANSSSDRLVVIDANSSFHLLPSRVISGLSDIVIQIDGNLIAWEGDIQKWPRDEFNSSIALISLNNTYNITFRGNGVLEGLGYRWWWHVILVGDDNRPYLLQMGNAENTLIEGLSFSNSPEYHLFLMNMKNLIVQNITITVDVEGQKSYLGIV